MKFIQYGCGHDAPPSWDNYDASPTIILERIPLLGLFYSKNSGRFPDCVKRGNIVKGLPVPNNTADGVYSSHTLEHLHLSDFRKALNNTFKVLKPGGTFRLVVPDLEYSIRQYCESNSPKAAHDFLDETRLGHHDRPTSFSDHLKIWFGGSFHHWMWDFDAMQLELAEANFVQIRRAQFGDGKISAFEAVERESRWQNCLGVECLKPKD